MPGHENIRKSLDRLAAAEEQFLNGRFLAPVVAGRKVQVRIAGVVCGLSVQPADFQGFGLFRPLPHSAAELVRPATLAERRRYLDLFPALAVVLCDRGGPAWLALPPRSDSRFHIEGLVTVNLADEVELFDIARVRFDGACFWFDQLDPRADPGAAAFLRSRLAELADPGSLHRPGLGADQIQAYAFALDQRIRGQLADRQRHDEHRLRQALAHAGAQLRDFADRGEVYRVSYEIDGRRHTSIVRRGDLTVQSAGICLSGEDENFDLHSLVGVLREGRQAGLIREFHLEE